MLLGPGTTGPTLASTPCADHLPFRSNCCGKYDAVLQNVSEASSPKSAVRLAPLHITSITGFLQITGWKRRWRWMWNDSNRCHVATSHTEPQGGVREACKDDESGEPCLWRMMMLRQRDHTTRAENAESREQGVLWLVNMTSDWAGGREGR